MITERLHGHKLVIYNGIDELPMERFFVYNRMMLIDSGIGSDLESVTTHLSKAIHYVSVNDGDKAIKQLSNLQNTLFFITKNITPKYMAFAALLHSIDGKPITDLSDENLTNVVNRISSWGTKKNVIDKLLEAVKKKFKTS